MPQLVASPFTPKPAIPRPWAELLTDMAGNGTAKEEEITWP